MQFPLCIKSTRGFVLIIIWPFSTLWQGWPHTLLLERLFSSGLPGTVISWVYLTVPPPLVLDQLMGELFRSYPEPSFLILVDLLRVRQAPGTTSTQVIHKCTCLPNFSCRARCLWKLPPPEVSSWMSQRYLNISKQGHTLAPNGLSRDWCRCPSCHACWTSKPHV